MKLLLAATLAASAAAFAPVTKPVSSSALKSAYEEELGVIAPTGFWDPAKLSSGIPQEKFDEYRLAELKHGRVAQLAVVGYVVQEIYRFPFDIAPGLPCSEVPNGFAALLTIPPLGLIQIIMLIAAVDTKGFLGDFEYGKLDLEPEEYEKRMLQELQHGRLAMIATLELFRHDTQNLVSPGFDGMDNLITGLPFLY
mmetsp:Transcript_19343/g.23937  ORF Transcript_19343/g.23937 Transcript_19343/m.23937 type:complete len:196 (-) Transcript_19343:259-846(-)